MPTTIKSKTIEDLYAEHNNWLSKLDFYEFEMNMTAGNTMGDENPSVACRHGVPYDR